MTRPRPKLGVPRTGLLRILGAERLRAAAPRGSFTPMDITTVAAIVVGLWIAGCLLNVGASDRLTGSPDDEEY